MWLRLMAHEAFDQRLHDGRLWRCEHDSRVAGSGFAELEDLREQHDGQPTATDAAMTPRNFTFSCAAGVEPSQ